MTSRPAGLRIAALAATLLTVLLAIAGVAAADDGVRIHVERIDTLQYPTMRIVAAVRHPARPPGRRLAAGAQLLKAPAGSRGAIVLVTDGFAPSSTTDQRASAVRQSRASLYPIYTVAVGAQLDRATFQGIADASGGQSFFAPSSAQLAS